MILVSLVVQAVWTVYESKPRSWQLFVKLSLVLLLIFVLYVPWLQRAVSISVGHTMKPTIADIVRTMFLLLGGFSSNSIGLKWVVVILFIAGSMACFVKSNAYRIIILAYVVFPVVFSILISYYYRPIWLFRTIAYLTPFWMILIACSLLIVIQDNHLPKFKPDKLIINYVLVFLVLLSMGYATLWQQTGNARFLRIKQAAQFLKSEVNSEDIIFIPNERIYWGIGWYLIAPGSVNPLTTNYMLKVKAGVEMYSKHSLPKIVAGKTYWVVYRSIDDISPFENAISIESRWDFNHLYIARLNK